jgi:hypothetical protein
VQTRGGGKCVVGRSSPAMPKQRGEKGREWGPRSAALGEGRGGEGRPVAMWRQGGRGGLAGDRQVVRPDPGSGGRGRAGGRRGSANDAFEPGRRGRLDWWATTQCRAARHGVRQWLMCGPDHCAEWFKTDSIQIDSKDFESNSNLLKLYLIQIGPFLGQIF